MPLGAGLVVWRASEGLEWVCGSSSRASRRGRGPRKLGRWFRSFLLRDFSAPCRRDLRDHPVFLRLSSFASGVEAVVSESGPHAPPRLIFAARSAGRRRRVLVSPTPRGLHAWMGHSLGIHASVRKCGRPASDPDPGVESFEKEGFSFGEVPLVGDGWLRLWCGVR
ncbi:hypothetical protein VUR80DRAFT_67 [Thermomyces stellatus]